MLEIIFRSCLGSRPKLPHVKGSLINCSVKGIKITHVCKGILRPKSHQDETGKLWEQDPPLLHLWHWKWRSPASPAAPDPSQNHKNGARPSGGKHSIFWGKRKKKIKFLFKDYHGLSHKNEPQSYKTQVAASCSWWLSKYTWTKEQSKDWAWQVLKT